MSWVLAQFVALSYALLGEGNGYAWTLAFVLMALAVTVLLAYPTRRQLEMQRLTWEIAPANMKIARLYKGDRARGNAKRREVYHHYGYQMWWQLGPVVLSLVVFLTLNSVVEGLASDTGVGVFAWPQYAGYVEDAQQATFLGVPYPVGLQTVTNTANPWLAGAVILLLLALMLPINATLQRQINGPPATSTWMRRQQRISLYAQPAVLLVLVVILNVAVGVMVFQFACDVFSLIIQTWWLRRRPIPPIDTQWLDEFLANLPEARSV